MLVDQGFSSAESFTLHEQQRATGIPQREIIRLETLAETLVKTANDPREWFAATRAALRAGIEGGAVGVKSICAYRASLELEPVDTDTLGVAFSALRLRDERGQSVRLVGDSLCHALLFEAAQECQQLDVPLQVHCGFGDPDEDLAQTSPLGLRPLFVDPTYRGLRIALLHCYPYHREAAYLCAVFPGVYMDLSLTIPFAGLEGFRAMRETLGLCPTSKLLYASDAGGYDVTQAQSFIDSLDTIGPEPDVIVLVGLAVLSYPGQEALVLRVPASMTPDALVAEVHRRLSLRATLLTTLAQAA